MNARSHARRWLFRFACLSFIGIPACAWWAPRPPDRTAYELNYRMHQYKLQEQCAKTAVWIDNRTGKTIRNVKLDYEVRASVGEPNAYACTVTVQTPIEAEPTEIWRHWFLRKITVVSLAVDFEDGSRIEQVVEHLAEPCARVNLVIADDKVTVK